MNAEVVVPAKAPFVPATRAGGLLVPPRGRLHPSFALFLFFLTVDVAALLFLPYFATRWTDSPWATADRLAFLGKAIAGGLAFGLVASISAERRNRSPWWFLAGHFGVIVAAVAALADFDRASPFSATLAVVVAGFIGAVGALFGSSKPADAPKAFDPALDAICRLLYAWSNIWFGILLMAVVAIATQYGSIHENRFNSKAAHFDVYRSWWFGATWFVAGVSMLAATFRKWPWRLEQSGWLTVHTGLGLVVIGSMMSFFSSVEGELALREGETGAELELRNASRFVVEEIGRRDDGRRFRRSVLDARTRFDTDPTEQEPLEEFRLPLGEDGTAVLKVDRYFTAARPYENWSDDGDAPNAGIELKLGTPDGASETFRLDERDRSSERLPFGSREFDIQFARLTKPLYEAILETVDPTGFGAVVIKDRAGKTVAELPVRPESRPTKDDGATAPLAGSAVIGETTVELLDYADNAGTTPGSTEMFDLSPGQIRNPSVRFKLKQGAAEEVRIASVFRPAEQADVDGWMKSAHPYAAFYEWRPRFKIEGPMLVFTPADAGMKWLFVGSDGKAVGGDVLAGVPLPLPMPMLIATPLKLFARAKIDQGFEFDGYRDGAPEAARVTVTADQGKPRTFWLRRGGQPQTFDAAGRSFAVAWRPERRPIGFSLKLNDFHRDFFPGSVNEKSFESYLELTHPTKFPTATDIKIDMNRPLRLDGWRLYQSRFGNDDATTFLQVNRDPGLSVIYPACCVVLLGLMIVSFLKKPMRERRLALERRGLSAARHIGDAVLTIAAVGAAPVLYGLWVSVGLPFGGVAAFLFGLVMVVLVPTAVVILYARKFGPSRTVARPESGS